MNKSSLSKVLAMCVLFVVLCNGTIAFAESPVGRWTGSFSGIGKKSKASATFRSDGTCTLTALGISATGSYGDGKIQVSMGKYSMTLFYAYSDDRMTISGKKDDYSGKMVLSKAKPEDEAPKDKKTDTASSPLLSKLKSIQSLLKASPNK